ncbi:MAG TPA: hypothetical protein VGR15_09375, partial [Bacteroidota bacterium]|nr:hypothetical protein [Bacteroidota bacterium]
MEQEYVVAARLSGDAGETFSVASSLIGGMAGSVLRSFHEAGPAVVMLDIEQARELRKKHREKVIVVPRIRYEVARRTPFPA